jgi:cell wall-associated NlpC family hydrolase
MSTVGSTVSMAELRPGDLVFFNTLRRRYSHVGIYVGNQRFIHAPTSGGVVEIVDLRRPYWQTRFDGARRLNI